MTTVTSNDHREFAERRYAEHPWASRLGVVWRGVAVVGTLIALSLAWVLALGLVVPLPMVTAAILRVTMAAARGRSPNALAEFLAGIRESWRRASVLGVLVAVVSVMFVADLWVVGAMPEPLATILRIALVLLAAWWALVNVYLWPLVGGTGMSMRSVLRAAVGLSLVELPSAGFAIAAAGLVILALTAVPATVVLLGPGLAASVWACLAWRGIRRHLADDDTAT
jgi:uncharacterized membrane protein YesL